MFLCVCETVRLCVYVYAPALFTRISQRPKDFSIPVAKVEMLSGEAKSSFRKEMLVSPSAWSCFIASCPKASLRVAIIATAA